MARVLVLALVLPRAVLADAGSARVRNAVNFCFSCRAGLEATAGGGSGAATGLLCQTRFLPPLPAAISAMERPVVTEFGLFFQNILGARRARRVVLRLDQQPIVVTLVIPLAHAHQVPAAVQLLAVKSELQMTLGIPFVRIADGLPRAAVPDHDGAAAIFALRDGALEAVVVDRMILDMDGEPLFARESRLGPRVTAQLFMTPSSSSRRS